MFFALIARSNGGNNKTTVHIVENKFNICKKKMEVNCVWMIYHKWSKWMTTILFLNVKPAGEMLKKLNSL
jgi:hypothetical protein